MSYAISNRSTKVPSLLALVLLLAPAGTHAQKPAEALKAFVGDRAAKIALVDRADASKLYLLDTEAGDEVVKIADDIEVHSPLFDAAGGRVVYSQVGKVYIQPLDGGARSQVTAGSEGHFWVDPATGDEWVYYTDNTKEMKLRWPDSRGVKTHRLKLDDNTVEHVLDWKAGGGPSRDGTHVGAGYASVIIFDLVGDTPHLLYDEGQGQGCNPSMSPDDSYLLMHLDLPHDTFSIRDKQDKLVWQIHKPEGTDEWQHPEWSVDGDFATATAKEPNGTYSVFVIQLSTHKTVKVLEAGSSGRDWAYPHLWIANAAQQVPALPEPPPAPAADGGTTTPDAGPGDAAPGDGGSGDGGSGGGGSDDGGDGGGCSLLASPPTTLPLALLALLLLGRRRR